MKHLIIIGARGFGREIFFLAKGSIGFGTEFTIKGYLDSDSEILNGYSNYPPILGAVEDYVVEKDDVFICALGDVAYKRHYTNIILSKGGEFITLLHKNAVVYSSANIGKGCVVFHGVTVSADVSVADFVALQPMVFLGHNAIVGKWSHLNTNCICCGFTELGDSVTIHTGAIVAPHKKIGNNAIVGAGSFVTRNVKENSTVYGNPAKKLI